MAESRRGEVVNFPAGFIWGAATASYQIEGAWNIDGKGESIWDRFSHTPGKIEDHTTGDIACDHYHHWQDDIGLMRQLGLKAYRFSVSWPRVMPQGVGKLNEKGLDFYDRLVDGLLDAGIEPFLTLYHWDLPQALQDKGGWTNRDTALAYAEYADAVSRRLGDRVHNWITFNEPWVSAFLGHLYGNHAPGVKNPKAAFTTAHHLLLGHGLAVPVLRANGNKQTQVGITLNLTPAYPSSDNEADLEAAFKSENFSNRWFLDPIFKASYPEGVAESFGGDPVPIGQNDLQTIAAPLDFLGVNYYFRAVVQASSSKDSPGFEPVDVKDGEHTEMGWEVYPDGLHKILTQVHQDYAPAKMYITENGAAYTDRIGPDGQVEDPRRTAYLRSHLASAQRAISEGVPLKGYFLWSLLDNFEWALGFSKRFGIVYVDYKTLKRTIKSSGHFYREVTEKNGFTF